MNKPSNPDSIIGKKIKTIDGKSGVIDLIGGLNENPWVLFSGNNISILTTWESIILTEKPDE